MNALAFLSAVDPISVANAAYDKDFRWWFLALLVTVFLAGVWVIRYFVLRVEMAEKNHNIQTAQLIAELSSSREHHQERMEMLTTQAFEQAKNVAAVIAANTAESREVRNYLERLQRNAS